MSFPRVQTLDFLQIHKATQSMLGKGLHAKRIQSLSDAALGVITSTSLIIHDIGQGLAKAKGLVSKHAIKQVDRLVSNKGINVWELFGDYVPYVIGSRKEIMTALDWTEFDADDHATIALNLVTTHGRATPLLWKTVLKSTLKNKRNDYEDELLLRFKEILPTDVKVTVLADRGFGDIKLYDFLHKELGFDFVIRFRGNIQVTNDRGETRTAAQWVGVGGRSRKLRNAKVTADRYEVPAVVCVQDKEMKQEWCLAATRAELLTSTIINYYSKRWTIEPNFRDIKDIRFGSGMSSTHISATDRRDRIFLINAIAMLFITLLGAAGESLGMDKLLYSNTAKYRQLSLFNQGKRHYELLLTMPEVRRQPLMERFDELLAEHKVFKEILWLI
jgi:hypothetical protein